MFGGVVGIVIGLSGPAHAQTTNEPATGTSVSSQSPLREPRPEPEQQLLTPSPPTPSGDIPLLKRFVPGLADWLKDQPAFIRDTSIKLHPRSFYFNRLNSNDTQNEAWAFGGWLDVQTGWLFDIFKLGATGYTSQPLYAPDETPGTLLLHDPFQESILTLGQAYAQFRYKEYALLTAYRQLVDEGYVNPADNRMIPNTFEGVTIKGELGPVGYNVGYLTAMKARDRHAFHDMAGPTWSSSARSSRIWWVRSASSSPISAAPVTTSSATSAR
ncbi:MAG: hypothetical protein DME02_07955 [Candidatus Rokuibacteriota bacterium]|nr:MAG: hypothetical protein DME02_07955 [Candidatus Rokubacteria bacterium]